MKKIKLPCMNPELIAGEIGEFIIKEILEEGRAGGVIGLSGGVDSTCSAALAKRAFDKHNKEHPDKPLELVGYLLPSKTNSPKDEEDAIKVAEKMRIRYETISIEPLVEAYSKLDESTCSIKYHKGNLMSELRALILHRKAACENKILIGTGNHDEDFGVGYYTLFGDGAVRISPLGNLPKRLVREMAAYLGFPEIANRVSSPGLEPNQTAFGDLGYRYEIIVELFTYGLEQGFSPEQLLIHPQMIEEADKQIEEYEKTFGYKKFKTAEEMIKDIWCRNKIAKGKARIVSPLVARISLEFR